MPPRVTQRSRVKQTPRVTQNTSRDAKVSRVVGAGRSLGRAADVRGGAAGARGSFGQPSPCPARGAETGGGPGCNRCRSWEAVLAAGLQLLLLFSHRRTAWFPVCSFTVNYSGVFNLTRPLAFRCCSRAAPCPSHSHVKGSKERRGGETLSSAPQLCASTRWLRPAAPRGAGSRAALVLQHREALGRHRLSLLPLPFLLPFLRQLQVFPPAALAHRVSPSTQSSFAKAGQRCASGSSFTSPSHAENSLWLSEHQNAVRIAGRAASCLALLLYFTLLLGQFSGCLQVTNPEDWALLFQSSVDFVTKLENTVELTVATEAAWIAVCSLLSSEKPPLNNSSGCILGGSFSPRGW